MELLIYTLLFIIIAGAAIIEWCGRIYEKKLDKETYERLVVNI